MIRIGELLAVPPEALPDLARLNEDGGATPWYPHPDGWPLYTVRKKCLKHGLYSGYSLKPQYDDEDTVVHPCETCLDRRDAEIRERQRQIAAEQHADNRRHATGRTSLRPRDPLGDEYDS